MSSAPPTHFFLFLDGQINTVQIGFEVELLAPLELHGLFVFKRKVPFFWFLSWTEEYYLQEATDNNLNCQIIMKGKLV